MPLYGRDGKRAGRPLLRVFAALEPNPPADLLPLYGRDGKRAGRPLLRVFAALKPSPPT
jgi:hypothetical protein